jgi:murein DD-endopeptidase MepM/ murein hydrolase activator NlpD
MPRLLGSLGLSLALFAAPLAGAQELAVRFYPDRVLRSEELDAAHGWSGALLQNAAIINLSDKPVTLERVEIEILAGGEPVQTHRFGSAALERAAARGAALKAQGAWDLFKFQFRPDVLLGKGVELSATRTLAPRTALFLGHRFFAWSGAPTELRLSATGRRADGTPVEAAAALAIESRPSQVAYAFPLVGRWLIGAGSTLHSHHRWAVPEEFALDIVRLGDGASTHRGDGTKLAEYYAYGQDVLAAADGTVVGVLDGVPESDTNLRRPGETAEAYMGRVVALQGEILAKGAHGALGNSVTLAHAGGEFSHYAHLLPGSARVKKGDAVKKGQPIARLGHSGSSTEPHLHFQVTDGADPLLSAGIPVRFSNLEIVMADGPRAPQTGDVVEARP